MLAIRMSVNILFLDDEIVWSFDVIIFFVSRRADNYNAIQKMY